MGYNFNYDFGSPSNDQKSSVSGFQPQKRLSDLSQSEGNYFQNNSTGQRTDMQQNTLSNLLDPPQTEPQFVDPGYQQDFGQGLIYKSSPESSTEYYSGPNAEAFYANYMARNGFGNMRSNDAGAVDRAIQRDNDAYYRRG